MSASVTRLDTRRASNTGSRPPRILGCLQVVRKHSKATGSARAVLNLLATYADPDGTNCNPGTDRIMAELGISEPTVKRARRKLVELGEVEIVREGTGSRSTEYRIRVGELADRQAAEPVDNSGTQTSGGVNMTPQGGQSIPPRGYQIDPQPTRDRPDTEGGDAELDDRCPAHRGLADAPPCRGCMRAREAVEARSLAQARARAVERREREQAEARETAAELARTRVAAKSSDTARAETSRARDQIAEARRVARASQNATQSGTLPTHSEEGSP